MSQRDHELMEAATADITISVPASPPPPPRDSMEDADPSLTRKRPRLDSGSVDNSAMHADLDSSVDSTAPPEQLVEMTIRSQPPSSSHVQDSPGSTGDTHPFAAPDEAIHIPATTLEDSAGAGDTSADSPPVIAIDDDDEADAMVEYAVNASVDVEYDADAYFAMFPFAPNGNYMHAVHEFAQYLQGSSVVEGNVLKQLIRWLDGLPVHPLTWRSFYTDQSAFWDEFSLVAQRVVSRKSPFGDQFGDDSTSDEEIIMAFLCVYIRLVARFTQVDASMLSQWPYEETYVHHVLSQKHVRHLSLILRQLYGQTHCHVFNLLRKEYQADVETMHSRLMKAYIEADGVKHLFNFAGHAYGKIPFPVQNYMAVNTAIIVDSVCCAIYSPLLTVEVISKADFHRNALTFFRQYDACLQVPSKVVDTGVTKELISCFSSLLYDLCQWDESLAAVLINEFLDFRDPESPTTASLDDSTIGRASYLQDPMEFPKLISNAWKFKLLRKYVVKGRMELRVMSIGFMDISLVELWKEYNASALSVHHPVMQYLADFLLHERVVDYIISVDSHPQLISRSGNIVGFLVVTRRYSDVQTDAIWNTVSRSSDPRVVSATMTMLRGIFGLMEEKDQLYLCSKLYELPIESYNIDILRFLRELTHKLVSREPDWADTNPNARPWNACIRVLQDTAPDKENTKLFGSLHSEVGDQLRCVAPYIYTEERHQIFRECAVHITSKSLRATGSVRAIFILASAAPYGYPEFFIENPGVVRDILEETCSFVRTEKDMAFNAQAFALQYRLELLSFLIYGASGAIPVDLYQDIWDHLIGKYAHTNHLRDLAWSKFLDAVKHKPDNDFCKQLVTVCVPKLDPVYYTPGMFDFVAAYRFPTIRRTVTTKRGTKDLLQIRGGDLLWAMILSAPPQTIEDRAAKLLASRYLEIDPSQGVDLDELEEAHIALVEQCMEELLSDSKVEPLDIDLPCGNAIDIKYQHPVTSAKLTITIGSENTLQDLYTRLCQAVGFTKLNLFAKGQRLNVLEKANEKIADLDLAQVLLVQKAPGAEVSRPLFDHTAGSSVFETTLLSHFDVLFACMDADDQISSVVYEFLSCFPYQNAILDSVTTGTASAERPTQEVSATYFSDERGLVERLLSLASVALTSEIDSGHVAWQSYCVIVEASLHSREIWDAFTSHYDVGALHEALLLSDIRKSLREAVAKAISSVCGGSLPPSSAITEADTATSFWHIISSVLPHSIQYPSQSEQLFELADQVFRKHDEHNRDEASLRSYLATWSDLLLNYHHEEKVGRDEIDFVVIGFTKLLLNCVSSLKSFKKPLNAGSLVEKIWNKFLFTPRVIELDEQASSLEMPVLESKTRKELYDLVLALAEDRNSYGALLALAGDLGVDDEDMALQAFCIDRANEIRAPTGYVGLFNPRAICYMNSLLTQLFMNVNFRKFILGLNVTDPRGAQILLHQTQKLFAEMQNSYRKSADPRGFAACVKAPEGTPIDINIQMDADEFYNLLFDQWEGQMLSPGIKERFRSFYGGHTVNQIKSKECEHVSERVESFFVVQCDVQGKQNLIESLQSFVEGDVMEGDNKYKCESCGGKLVDAVKRTCLKDVPDNLIFHLKRFDFDLVELRRAKINDHFEFPTYIDVSHFKIDHLSDPSKPRQEDIFELVGVLVHQGTSENGHYYSYIRERPSPSGNIAQWVEFNDRDVDAFDHQTLPYHAYGGYYEDNFSRQQKQFSAYMLFYQRRASIEKDHCEYIGTPQSGIAKVAVPPALDQTICADNESLIREYSLYDPNHTKFVRQLLANLRTINHGTCSEDHQQETQALHTVLEHLCQTLFRVKNADIFDEIILQLRKTALSCSTCCHVALKWFATHQYALINILLQCVHTKIRSQTRSFLIDSLQSLREKDPVAYGIEAMETDSDSGSIVQPEGVLAAIAKSLYFVCENSHLSTRGWDDVYLTLCQLSDLGHVETAVLLDHGFLEFCLRVFCMHATRIKEPDLLRIVEKKKRIYNRMIEFVYRMLSKIDMHIPVLPSKHQGRVDNYERNGYKFALTQDEKKLLQYWHEDNKAFAFLDKMLEVFDPTKTDIFYPGEIIKLMLNTVSPQIQQYLFCTVYEGVCQLQPYSSDPYVRAALSYCEASPERAYVDQVIDIVGKQMIKYREGGGEVNIRFLNGLLRAENEVIFEERGVDYFYSHSLVLARKVSITLLLYDDEIIRKATATHLEELLTGYKDDENTPEDILKQKYKVIRILASETCDKIGEEYQNTTSRSYVQPLVLVCQMLVRLLHALNESDDLSLEPFKSGNDWAIIEKFESHVAPRLRNWPLEESTPVSAGDLAEPYDHSDYGSESDVDLEQLDL
ncbi:hypothetical protein N0V90_006007 [Kalmusia sp. IMI 367209]|nr:hypothetical protein N0V90_006007 [Kalmusia sp. IMI 367209]